MDFRHLSFLEAPLIRTPPPGSESKKYLDYQSLHESSVVSYPRGMPMAIKRAKGATVEDVDGNIYIDFFGGAGVMNVGHSNPEVIKAAENQLGNLTHALDFPHAPRKALIEILLTLLPPSLNRVFFGGPSGSDAVEAAVKLAKYNSHRIPVIAFEGSYHGMSAGALSLSSGRSFKEGLLPLVPEAHYVPYAYCYRCAFGQQRETCNLDCAQYFEHILEDPHSGVSKPAAVIIEAIQGEGGSIVPPPQFLPKIREICSRHGLLMIVDEVQAGFCRTGKMFAFEHTSTTPDMVTMSKALGGVGFPIACLAFREDLDKWPAGKHIGTFRGNVLAYAAGQAALRFMVKNRLAEHVYNLGQTMLSWLKEVERESEIIGEVRGKGLMIGIELVKDKSPAPSLAREVRRLCHRRGLLVEIGGHYFNVIRFLPPLVLTEELAIKGIEIFEDAVREVGKSR